MEDNCSDSYSESRIEALRRQVEVGKSEMLQLAYHEDQLMSCIAELNQRGRDCITGQQFYEAIVYLSEAEKVLEYAAGCGQTIDRTLILTTLHNQACAYQRIWELPKSADYLQAIIYNTSSFLKSDGSCECIEGSKPSPQLQNKLSLRLSNQLHLISSHLQFCAVSSQIKNHQNALASAEQALCLLKNSCEELYNYQKRVGFACLIENQKNLLLELQNIRNFQNQGPTETERNIQKLLYKARKSIAVFQKKMTVAAVGLNKNEVKELQNFSLGQLMQVGPVGLDKMQSRVSVAGQLSYLRKIYRAIYISIAHFTMATELRLLANERHGMDNPIKKASRQFKESQVHHLVGLITVALYVPCYTKYFDHILNSFKNHYNIDLTQNSDISSSQEEVNKLDDDLIHLEIQSISQRDSGVNQADRHSEDPQSHSQRMSYNQPRTTNRSNLSNYKDKVTNRTLNDITSYGSYSSSEKSRLKAMGKTARQSETKSFKKKEKTSKKKLGEVSSKEKKSRLEKASGKSKGKSRDKPKHSKSRKSVVQCSEQKEKVVHYFQYDNKKVVRKKVRVSKEGGECEFGRKSQKGIRDKRSPEAIISQELKKINHFAQSTKELIRHETAGRGVKKAKSPQLSTSRSHKIQHKKGS